MRKAPVAATLSIAAIACSVWLLASDRGQQLRPPRVMPALSGSTPTAERGVLSLPSDAADNDGPPPRATDAVALEQPRLSADRIAAAVAELARNLSSPQYDQSLWTTQLRATSRSLGVDATDMLRNYITDAERGVAAHVSAAELLRVLQTTVARRLPPIDANALSSIRTQALGTADDGMTVPPAVAMRALAAWGTALDHERLTETAFPATGTDGDASASQSALFALAYSASADVAMRLAERGTDRAFIALASFETSSGWSLTALDRLDVAARIDTRLQDASADEGTRLRALAILERYDAETARVRIAALVRDAHAPERLVERATERLLRGDAGAEQVATALEALASDNALSVAVACAPSLQATPDPLLSSRVLDVLTNTVGNGPDASDRLRATNALGALGRIGSREALADALRSDPNDAVRAAAATALRPFGGEALREWAVASEEDPSEAVRALCRHELARLGALRGDS